MAFTYWITSRLHYVVSINVSMLHLFFHIKATLNPLLSFRQKTQFFYVPFFFFKFQVCCKSFLCCSLTPYGSDEAYTIPEGCQPKYLLCVQFEFKWPSFYLLFLCSCGGCFFLKWVVFCCNRALLALQPAVFGQLFAYLPLSITMLLFSGRGDKTLAVEGGLLSPFCNVCSLFPPPFWCLSHWCVVSEKLYLLNNSWFFSKLLINMDFRYASLFQGHGWYHLNTGLI